MDNIYHKCVEWNVVSLKHIQNPSDRIVVSLAGIKYWGGEIAVSQ